MNTGVYEIVNTANGKRYVGASVNMPKRWREHRCGLRHRRHHAMVLQRAWDKYGEASFIFRPLLVCARHMLSFYEQRAIDAIRPEYNASQSAWSPMSDPAIAAKVGAALKGHPVSAETRAKISAANKGRKQTPEAVAARKAGAAGRSPEAKAETAKKLSIAGKLRYEDPAERERLSARTKGRVVSEAVREKHRAYALNRPEAHNAKLSAAASARYAKLRKVQTP